MQIWPDGSGQYSASETVNTKQRDGIKYWLILATLACKLSVHYSILHVKTDNLNVMSKCSKSPTETAILL